VFRRFHAPQELFVSGNKKSGRLLKGQLMLVASHLKTNKHLRKLDVSNNRMGDTHLLLDP
jgi:hypothetical protein